MNTDALLLTAYERTGSVGMDEFIECFIDEDVEVTESMIGDFNEYLSDNYEECFYNDLSEILEGLSPVTVAAKTFYGDFSFGKDFHRFNGNGNVDSFWTYQVINIMKADKDFLKWYVLSYNLFDFHEAESIIFEANVMISQGF